MQIPHDIEALRELTRDNPAQQEDLEQVQEFSAQNWPSCGRRSNCGGNQASKPPRRRFLRTGASGSWTHYRL